MKQFMSDERATCEHWNGPLRYAMTGHFQHRCWKHTIPGLYCSWHTQRQNQFPAWTNTTPVVSALKLWFYRHSAAKQNISGHLSARYVRCVFTMELDGIFFSIRGEAQMEGKDAGDHSTESPCWELQETNSQNTHTKGKRQSKRPHLNGDIFSSRFVQKENIYSLLWHYLLWNVEYNESDLRLLSIKKAL